MNLMQNNEEYINIISKSGNIRSKKINLPDNYRS